jgi:hypothetical protein
METIKTLEFKVLQLKEQLNDAAIKISKLENSKAELDISPLVLVLEII